MGDEANANFSQQVERWPLDSDEEVAAALKAILGEQIDPGVLVKLVEYVQASVQEALILRTPAVPFHRLGKTALASDIRTIGGFSGVTTLDD